ncbi:MAG: 16S rRNA (guanine(966)-N(2))-methyltransferase RsmD [Bdellovibrionaceae bacterium]|nr:16S rRNA (guanine(966)-N(2))-methyltransferase RsmD [Pseudobdellovibrionaceae bacterium]|tara:strand:- start:31652 stop:32203 length:552 start_codon:yes stop_codon:yes gene_type:complete
MRIISGKFGGRKLVHFQADHLRPTTDRIKESIFNSWSERLPEAKVLDLFSGTGNLSFEAISWGAASVVSVEMNKKSIAIIEKNRELLGVGKEQRIINKDVLKFLKSYDSESFDLIFIDPPFTKKMADEVMQAVSQSKVFHQDTLIVIESTKHETIKDQYGDIFLYRRKDYGDKKLSFYELGEN